MATIEKKQAEEQRETWHEYRRLVLQELERLDSGINKLNHDFGASQLNLIKQLSTLREEVGKRFSKVNMTILDSRRNDLVEIEKLIEDRINVKARIDTVQSMHAIDQNTQVRLSRWGLLTAIITICGSLIISIIGLFI